MIEFFDLFMTDVDYFVGTVCAGVGFCFAIIVCMMIAGVFDAND